MSLELVLVYCRHGTNDPRKLVAPARKDADVIADVRGKPSFLCILAQVAKLIVLGTTKIIGPRVGMRINRVEREKGRGPAFQARGIKRVFHDVFINSLIVPYRRIHPHACSVILFRENSGLIKAG
jgi:hypothetical protein